MGFESLLVSRDSEAVSILRTVLGDLKVETEVCSDLQAAVERLAHGGIAAVVVDYDVEHATELLKLIRQNYAGSCVAVALVKGLPSIQAAYELGANFVLIKPITLDSASRSLLEAVALVSRMVARRARLVVPTLAYVDFEGTRDPAIILDLGEGGMAVQALQPIDATGPLRVHFDVPGSLDAIDVQCEIVWADSTGRAGLRFVDLSDVARQQLQGWLRLNGATSQHTRPREERLVPAPPSPVPVLSRREEQPQVPSVAQRIFSGLVDGIIILLASMTFNAIFWIWARRLPSSSWTLPVGLAVPFLFTILYLYLFLVHPRGTPGMQMAEKGSRAAKTPEMFDVIPAPRLVTASSRVLSWMEAHGRDESSPPPPSLGPLPAMALPPADIQTDKPSTGA